MKAWRDNQGIISETNLSLESRELENGRVNHQIPLNPNLYEWRITENYINTYNKHEHEVPVETKYTTSFSLICCNFFSVRSACLSPRSDYHSTCVLFSPYYLALSRPSPSPTLYSIYSFIALPLGRIVSYYLLFNLIFSEWTFGFSRANQVG